MDQIGSSDLFSDLQVDAESKSILQTTVKWAKISAIIGLVSVAILLITSLSGMVKAGNNPFLEMFSSVGLFFIIPIAIVMVIIYIFLLRFATSTAQGMLSADQGIFNQGISFLKLYFKTVGIVIIVLIAFVLIVLIAAGLGNAVG